MTKMDILTRDRDEAVAALKEICADDHLRQALIVHKGDFEAVAGSMAYVTPERYLKMEAELAEERAKNDPNGKWRIAERAANFAEAARWLEDKGSGYTRQDLPAQIRLLAAERK